MENSIDNLKTFEDDFTSYTVELKEGQLLGVNRNYRLEKNLGVGGMGEVWLAAKILEGEKVREVVVKTLRPDRRGNEGAQEKALKQFQLIQTLNHTNICPIYDIEKDPSCGYLIVMGYAGGGSYADWFAGQPKPLAEVCRVLRPIADALDFAHSKGVIHRDVKPENMMFMEDGTPWLIDFGIAARLRSESMATQGQFTQSGTVSYMAPEQKSGEFQTAQTDEYALAMVALEFLTGSLSPLSLLELSPEFQTILKKALAQEPSSRYATCREFIDALSGAKPLAPAPRMVVTPPKTSAAVTTLPAPLKSGNVAGERKVLTVSGIDYAFRWCPPGEFMMGGNKYDCEKPVHKVILTEGFWMLETPVTQVMWRNVMGNNPSLHDGSGFLGFGTYNASNYPVEQVSWDDCQIFCQKLSQKLGLRVQLPTEAQWEYACRAGSAGDYAGDIKSMAWYFKNSWLTTHEVGWKKSNQWGLYDMHGNVWEWCSDYYDGDYYSKSPTNDPENTEASPHRVLRGGSWEDNVGCCRSAYRLRDKPGIRDGDFGLRVLVVPGQD